jgi:thermitase
MRIPLRAVALAIALAAALAVPAAASSYDPHTVLVRFRPGADPMARTSALGTGSTVGTVHGVGTRIVHVAGDPAVVAAALNRSPLVQYAEVDRVLHASAVPNDPLFGQLYGLNNLGQTGGTPNADINAPEGWDAAGLGAFPATGGVKVGLVDSGVLATHEDLAGKIADCASSQEAAPVSARGITEGSCADDDGHGTHVAGTVAADANNGKGIAGVAFNSQLAVCKALSGPFGSGTDSEVANCLTWAHDKGAKVISMSLGGNDSATLHDAVTYAWHGGDAAGSVLVAAAGNAGDDSVDFPAGYPEVVSVAATDATDARAPFSNANPKVEVTAPGVGVLSTFSDGSYTQMSGTSMSTPVVAGVAAIIWDKYPTAAAGDIRAKLDASVDDLGPPGRDPQFGFGRVNVQKAAGS